MTSASETDFLRVTENFEKMEPENQVFFALLIERLADRVENDPEAERMPTHDLFREVIHEVAPERVADYDRYLRAKRPSTFLI